MRLAYLAQGKLFLKDGDRAPRQIDSHFGQDVVNRTLRNVPPKALYNWDPGAYFGIHRPDTFWLDAAPRT